MNRKLTAALAFALLSLTVSAQKLFTVGDVACRNDAGDWVPACKTTGKFLRISGDDIQLQLDKTYRLRAYQTTHLPNRGAIYLCTDERGNNVTAMLINDGKLFLYADSRRYQISLQQPRPLASRGVLADTGD